VAEQRALAVGEAAEGPGRLTGCELRQPFGLLLVRAGLRDHEGSARSPEHGAGGTGIARLLQQHRQLNHPQTLATVVLRHRDPRPAQLRDLLPERVVVGAGLRQVPDLLGLEARSEELVRGPLDLLLLVVEVEVHPVTSVSAVPKPNTPLPRLLGVTFTLTSVGVGRARAPR